MTRDEFIAKHIGKEKLLLKPLNFDPAEILSIQEISDFLSRRDIIRRWNIRDFQFYLSRSCKVKLKVTLLKGIYDLLLVYNSNLRPNYMH